MGQRTDVTGPALVFGAAVSVQVGAALAKSLFDEVGPPAVVLMRLAFGAVAVWLLYRPRFRGRSAAEIRLVVALGIVLACMNNIFYEALARIPLGVAVTIEFLGPLAVAVIWSHRAVDLVWIGLAAGGIALLAAAATCSAPPCSARGSSSRLHAPRCRGRRRSRRCGGCRPTSSA